MIKKCKDINYRNAGKKLLAFIVLTSITEQASEELVSDIMSFLEHNPYARSLLGATTIFLATLVESGSDVFIDNAAHGSCDLKDNAASFIGGIVNLSIGTLFSTGLQSLSENIITNSNASPGVANLINLGTKFIAYLTAYGFGHLAALGAKTVCNKQSLRHNELSHSIRAKQVTNYVKAFIGFAGLGSLTYLSSRKTQDDLLYYLPFVQMPARTLLNSLIASSLFFTASLFRPHKRQNSSKIIASFVGFLTKIMLPAELMGVISILLEENAHISPTAQSLTMLLATVVTYFLGYKAGNLVEEHVRQRTGHGSCNSIDCRKVANNLLAFIAYVGLTGVSYFALEYVQENLLPALAPAMPAPTQVITSSLIAAGFFNTAGSYHPYTSKNYSQRLRSNDNLTARSIVSKTVGFGTKAISLGISLGVIKIALDYATEASVTVKAVSTLALFGLAGYFNFKAGNAVEEASEKCLSQSRNGYRSINH